MHPETISRRRFGGECLALGVVLSCGLAAQAADPLPISELNLPAGVLAELQRAAAGAIEEARSLAELPLDGVEPFFVFRPD